MSGRGSDQCHRQTIQRAQIAARVIGAVSHPRALPREEGWLLTGGGLDEEDARRDERQM